jgi:hypothetical protein
LLFAPAWLLHCVQMVQEFVRKLREAAALQALARAGLHWPAVALVAAAPPILPVVAVAAAENVLPPPILPVMSL